MWHIAVESFHVNKRLEVLRIYKLLVRYGIEVASIRPQPDEVEPFVRSLKAVPKSGQHNPLKNPERCATEPCCDLSCHAVAVTSRQSKVLAYLQILPNCTQAAARSAEAAAGSGSE